MDYRFTQDGRPERVGAVAGLFPNCRYGLFILTIGLSVTLYLYSDIALAKKGRFEIRTADSRLYNGVYFASALVDYDLSDEALEALESGVALPINLRIELNRVRRWWPDKEVATLEQNYQLSYQALSQRYIVKNLNSGEQESFATLFSALKSMGRVVDLPIIDASLLNPRSTYEIRIRVILDQSTLPGPIRILAFWSSGFKLQSKWYVWKLNN
jgi:hypothetical protein